MTEAERFLAQHAARCGEWRQAAQAWIFGGAEVARQLGPYLILVHSSEGNAEKHLLPRLRQVRMYGGFPVQGGGAACGHYRGTEIWILHQFMGCTATQLWMECLAGTPVQCLIGLAEMTAYSDKVAIGDIVLPAHAWRGDLVTAFHVSHEAPASADADLLTRLHRKLLPANWPVHSGTVYSGMPGGVGVHNPILREQIWGHLQAGILGNAIEVSVAYIEAARLGLRAASLWAVSDDLAVGTGAQSPESVRRWERAWDLMAQAALDVLADLAAETAAA